MSNVVEFPKRPFHRLETFGTIAGLTISLIRAPGSDTLHLSLTSDELKVKDDGFVELEAFDTIERFPEQEMGAAKAAGRIAFLAIRAAVHRMTEEAES